MDLIEESRVQAEPDWRVFTKYFQAIERLTIIWVLVYNVGHEDVPRGGSYSLLYTA